MTSEYKATVEKAIELTAEIGKLTEQAIAKGTNLDRTMQRIREANESLAFCIAAIQSNLERENKGDVESSL